MMVVGLGSIPAAGWRPARGWQMGARGDVFGPSALTRVATDSQMRQASSMFTPAFAVQTCGMPGGLPCMAASPQAAMRGLSGLGAPWYVGGPLCKSLSAKVDELGLLVAEAERLEFSSVAYQQAKAKYDSEVAFTTAEAFADPAACDVATKSLQPFINALAPEVKRSGGTVPVPSDIYVPPEAPSDITGTIKTVAIAAGVIAGVVVLAPIVWEVVAGVKLARRARR